MWFTAEVAFPLLASLPPEATQRLLEGARRRTFHRREVLVHEGDVADSLHLVQSGRLAVQVSLPSGQVASLRIIKAGDHFGELALLDRPDPHRSATIIALEPSQTLSISSATFRRLRSEHPAVQDLLTQALAERVEELSRRLLETMYEGLDRRVYRQLVVLAEVYADPPSSNQVTIPLTQETLAEFVGGARPSVNVVLNKLADRGLVRIGRGRITILDRDGLAARVR